jgi:hypothetical protein
MVELELALRNLPYLFDCRVRFNNTSESQTYDGITIPPYHAVIFFSGEAKEEITDIIARKMLFPTVQTNDSVTLEYHNAILLSGVQEYHIIPFHSLNFGIKVSYPLHEQYITDFLAQGEMTKALNLAFISESHDSDFITENDVYTVLNGLSLAGLTVLDVNLMQGGNEVPYINIPISRIPKLTGITYNNVDLEG